jgi:hypothetical protein
VQSIDGLIPEVAMHLAKMKYLYARGEDDQWAVMLCAPKNPIAHLSRAGSQNAMHIMICKLMLSKCT